MPPSAPPPAEPICSTIYGEGDCSEFNFCTQQGDCINGLCRCWPGYEGLSCNIRVFCRFWDTELLEWSTEGCVTNATDEGDLLCICNHLTEFGGLSLPSDPSALLSEFTSIQFNTFSMSEAFQTLSDFDFGANPAIYITIFTLSALDFFSLWYGFYRERRRRKKRARSNREWEEEKQADELKQFRKEMLFKERMARNQAKLERPEKGWRRPGAMLAWRMQTTGEHLDGMYKKHLPESMQQAGERAKREEFEKAARKADEMRAAYERVFQGQQMDSDEVERIAWHPSLDGAASAGLHSRRWGEKLRLAKARKLLPERAAKALRPGCHVLIADDSDGVRPAPPERPDFRAPFGGAAPKVSSTVGGNAPIQERLSLAQLKGSSRSHLSPAAIASLSRIPASTGEDLLPEKLRAQRSASSGPDDSSAVQVRVPVLSRCTDSTQQRLLNLRDRFAAAAAAATEGDGSTGSPEESSSDSRDSSRPAAASVQPESEQESSIKQMIQSRKHAKAVERAEAAANEGSQGEIVQERLLRGAWRGQMHPEGAARAGGMLREVQMLKTTEVATKPAAACAGSQRTLWRPPGGDAPEVGCRSAPVLLPSEEEKVLGEGGIVQERFRLVATAVTSGTEGSSPQTRATAACATTEDDEAAPDWRDRFLERLSAPKAQRPTDQPSAISLGTGSAISVGLTGSVVKAAMKFKQETIQAHHLQLSACHSSSNEQEGGQCVVQERLPMRLMGSQSKTLCGPSDAIGMSASASSEPSDDTLRPAAAVRVTLRDLKPEKGSESRAGDEESKSIVQERLSYTPLWQLAEKKAKRAAEAQAAADQAAERAALVKELTQRSFTPSLPGNAETEVDVPDEHMKADDKIVQERLPVQRRTQRASKAKMLGVLKEKESATEKEASEVKQDDKILQERMPVQRRSLPRQTASMAKLLDTLSANQPAESAADEKELPSLNHTVAQSMLLRRLEKAEVPAGETVAMQVLHEKGGDFMAAFELLQKQSMEEDSDMGLPPARPPSRAGAGEDGADEARRGLQMQRFAAQGHVQDRMQLPPRRASDEATSGRKSWDAIGNLFSATGQLRMISTSSGQSSVPKDKVEVAEEPAPAVAPSVKQTALLNLPTGQVRVFEEASETPEPAAGDFLRAILKTTPKDAAAAAGEPAPERSVKQMLLLRRLKKAEVRVSEAAALRILAEQNNDIRTAFDLLQKKSSASSSKAPLASPLPSPPGSPEVGSDKGEDHDEQHKLGKHQETVEERMAKMVGALEGHAQRVPQSDDAATIEGLLPSPLVSAVRQASAQAEDAERSNALAPQSSSHILKPGASLGGGPQQARQAWVSQSDDTATADGLLPTLLASVVRQASAQAEDAERSNALAPQSSSHVLKPGASLGGVVQQARQASSTADADWRKKPGYGKVPAYLEKVRRQREEEQARELAREKDREREVQVKREQELQAKREGEAQRKRETQKRRAVAHATRLACPKASRGESSSESQQQLNILRPGPPRVGPFAVEPVGDGSLTAVHEEVASPGTALAAGPVDDALPGASPSDRLSSGKQLTEDERAVQAKVQERVSFARAARHAKAAAIIAKHQQEQGQTLAHQARMKAGLSGEVGSSFFERLSAAQGRDQTDEEQQRQAQIKQRISFARAARQAKAANHLAKQLQQQAAADAATQAFQRLKSGSGPSSSGASFWDRLAAPAARSEHPEAAAIRAVTQKKIEFARKVRETAIQRAALEALMNKRSVEGHERRLSLPHLTVPVPEPVPVPKARKPRARLTKKPPKRHGALSTEQLLAMAAVLSADQLQEMAASGMVSGEQLRSMANAGLLSSAQMQDMAAAVASAGMMSGEELQNLANAGIISSDDVAGLATAVASAGMMSGEDLQNLANAGIISKDAVADLATTVASAGMMSGEELQSLVETGIISKDAVADLATAVTSAGMMTGDDLQLMAEAGIISKDDVADLATAVANAGMMSGEDLQSLVEAGMLSSDQKESVRAAVAITPKRSVDADKRSAPSPPPPTGALRAEQLQKLAGVLGGEELQKVASAGLVTGEQVANLAATGVLNGEQLAGLATAVASVGMMSGEQLQDLASSGVLDNEAINSVAAAVAMTGEMTFEQLQGLANTGALSSEQLRGLATVVISAEELADITKEEPARFTDLELVQERMFFGRTGRSQLAAVRQRVEDALSPSPIRVAFSPPGSRPGSARAQQPPPAAAPAASFKKKMKKKVNLSGPDMFDLFGGVPKTGFTKDWALPEPPPPEPPPPPPTFCEALEIRTRGLRARAKTFAGQKLAELKEVRSRVWETLRNEHTIINFLSPPEDEEALTEMQVVQLFWNTLMLELVLICLLYEPEPECPPGSAAEECEAEPIPIIQSFIIGGIVSGITFASIFISRKIFRWGNQKRLPPPREHGRVTKLAKRILVPVHQAVIDRLFPYYCEDIEDDEDEDIEGNVQQTEVDAEEAKRLARREREEQKRQAFYEKLSHRRAARAEEAGTGAGTGIPLAIGVRVSSPPPSPPETPLSRIDEPVALETIRSGSPVLLQQLSSNVLDRVQRQNEAFCDGADSFMAQRLWATAAEEAAASRPSTASTVRSAPSRPSSAGSPAGKRTLPRLSSRAIVGDAASSSQAGAAPVPMPLLGLGKAGGGFAKLRLHVQQQQPRDGQGIAAGSPKLAMVVGTAVRQERFLAQVAAAKVNAKVEERLRLRFQTPEYKAKQAKLKKMSEMNWRDPRVYRARMMFAWLLNFMVFTVCGMHAVVYGRMFGKRRTTDMLVGWLMASGQTWGIVEPTQVVMLALLPLLIKEDTRCGRCFERARSVYNEVFA